jgi:hypothetical protein
MFPCTTPVSLSAIYPSQGIGRAEARLFGVSSHPKPSVTLCAASDRILLGQRNKRRRRE